MTPRAQLRHKVARRRKAAKVRPGPKTEPKFPSPTKVVIDLGTQVLSEAGEEKASANFILQERQERKKKVALEVARDMQVASLSNEEAQYLVELEVKRLERLQQ